MAKVTKKTTKKVTKKASSKEAALSKRSKIYGEILNEFAVKIVKNDGQADDYSCIGFRNAALNMIMGGGLIEGTALEISGVSQSGKSYLGYELMAQVLASNGYVYLNDNECAYSKSYGYRSGIPRGAEYLLDEEKDIDTFFRTCRQFIKSVRKYDKTGKILIITDSYGGLSTNTDMDNEEAKKDPRGYMYMHKANTFGTNMRTFTKWLKHYNATLVSITQAKLDKAASTQYYKVYASAAEDTLNFFYTQRLRVLSGGKLTKEIKIPNSSKKKKVPIGQMMKVECIKNRIAAPFQKAEIEVYFNGGIPKYSGVEGILIDEGLITKGKFTQDGQQVKGYKHVESGDKFTSIDDMIEVYPELIKPKNHFNSELEDAG